MSDLARATALYQESPDVCHHCGGPVQFCDECSTCSAPDGDCFDLAPVATCPKCLGCAPLDEELGPRLFIPHDDGGGS